MTIVDAHLDLAYNALRGRDVTKPAREQPIAENEIATHASRSIAVKPPL